MIELFHLEPCPSSYCACTRCGNYSRVGLFHSVQARESVWEQFKDRENSRKYGSYWIPMQLFFEVIMSKIIAKFITSLEPLCV